jgi:hypothetical protein
MLHRYSQENQGPGPFLRQGKRKTRRYNPSYKSICAQGFVGIDCGGAPGRQVAGEYGSGQQG